MASGTYSAAVNRTSDDPTRSADPYATLGVSPGATDEEIKRAWKKLAREHHPDRNPGDPDAARRFKAIADAYAILGDPDARKKLQTERGRTTASEEFLADFTDAVERAERLVFVELLARYRAGPAERVALLARDVVSQQLLTRAGGPPPGWFARWQARREARRFTVHLDYRSRPDRPAEAWRIRSGWVIVLYPGAFWAKGVRESGALDDAVLDVLAGWVLGILAQEARVDLYGLHAGAADAMVERAREQDGALRRARAANVGLWVGIALLAAVFWYSAWSSQFD
jgi:hypothetical protein